MALPDFLLVGAPKAGTTALHAGLAGHPELFLSTPKEPKFFLCGGRPPAAQNGPGDAHSVKEWVWDRAEYEQLFDPAPPGTLRGESTPLYLADHVAHERMARLIPEAKLIVVVRDPVDRAYSNWSHLWSDGLEPVGDFLEACALEDERVARGWAAFWRYKWQGRYGHHLAHLYACFPAEQVHVLRYRELVESPAHALDGICAHLGIERGVVDGIPDANVSSYIEPSRVNQALQSAVRNGARMGRHLPPRVWRSASQPLVWALKRRRLQRPALSPDDRAELRAYFADDIDLLESLTGRCFGDWLVDQEPSPHSLRRQRHQLAAGNELRA